MGIRGIYRLIPLVLLLISAPTAMYAAQAAAATAPATATARRAVAVCVDPRVELFSILFNLAGNPEYGRPLVGSYAQDVRTHFEPVKEHEAVKLARWLRQSRGVGYDAPMSLAVHFADVTTLDLVLPVDPLPAGIDGRWETQRVLDFQRELRRFVADSRFQEFLAAHHDLYDQSAARMRQTLDTHARLEWFDAFFGSRPAARFHLVLGMLNGGSCYGVRVTPGVRITSPNPPRDGEDLYCILGVWSSDSDGVPTFGRSVLPTVIHEFTHSYANPLVDERIDELRAAGDELLTRNEAQMRSQAYSSGRTVLYESLVRACVVRYRYANEGMAAAMMEIVEQKARGFSWVGELSARLEEYESRRDVYPNLESFMPRIVACLNEYVAKLPDR
jgi:hypothetical protein